MADANLLETISKRGKKQALENVIVFGKVRCAIERPAMLNGVNTVGGFFALIDAYAFKCLGEDYFGSRDIYDVNRVYFTRGSLVIFMDDKSLVGKNIKVFGSSFRRGCKIKQQFGVKDPREGITALQYMRDNKTDSFVVVPNKVLELGKVDKDVRGTALEDFMVSVATGGGDTLPRTLDSIESYMGVSEYKELNLDAVPDTASSGKFVSESGKIDVSKIDLHLTYHMDARPKSVMYDDFQEDIVRMAQLRKDFIKSQLEFVEKCYKDEIKNGTTIYNMGDILDVFNVALDVHKRFVNNIATRYTGTIGDSKVRGAYYVSQILDEISTGNLCPIDKEDKRDLLNEVDSLASAVVADATVLFGYGGYEDIEFLRSNIPFAIAVVALSIGVDIETLAYNCNFVCNTFSVTRELWFYTLLRYPYLLGMLGTGLSLVECDGIYFSFCRYYSRGAIAVDNLEMRSKLVFLETLSTVNDKNSLVNDWEMSKARGKYPAIGKRYFERNGLPIRDELYEFNRVLFDDNIGLSPEKVEKILNVNWYSEERKNDLMDNGLVNTIDDMMILESDLEKEFLIYDVLVEKGAKPTGLTDGVIDSTIAEFEASKGFALEKLQRDGVHLTKYKAAVLSGCAGSGKTTTSDCMTMALKKLEHFDDNYELVYCTPTGKACRRLAEVVKSTVRTINSQFGVGISGGSYMAPVYMKYKPAGRIKIYLMDEMAMCSMPLLYEICRNLGPEDMIYFLGDIKQLPPIGKGNPFALLMQQLPCVELGVSKRAAEGSDINYNTTLINCMSDALIRELNYNDKDFLCEECADAMIPMSVTNVWRRFMDGSMTGKKYSEDDIQVITGYQKEDVVFSAPQLNKPLQKLLRRNDKALFTHTNREFYENDRVIHTKLNSYAMNRYVEVEPGIYNGIVTFGIVNGEMGKLMGVYRSDMVNIIPFEKRDCHAGVDIYENVSEEQMEELLKKREDRNGDFRDDTRVKNNRQYFVKVMVYDVELGRDVYVLYTVSGHPDGFGGLVVEGSDAGCLELAYALTTHKMQGSQSPVVICPFGSNCNPHFINRNMLNTMFTRSMEVVCCVGSVRGSSSPINMGRRYASPTSCSDALTVLITE